jgi:hypothetical protein
MEDGLQIQIIYKYLREYDVSRLSFNKMKLVQQFLMGDNNKTKLRIGTNSYLAKIKDKLVIVK